MEAFQYVVGSSSELSEMEANTGGKGSPVCCIIVLPLLFQLCVQHKQVINVILFMGKGPLTSNTERFVRFATEASEFGPDCFF